MQKWNVYVLHFDRAYKHAKHYTGITNDFENRMEEHKKGQGARLTQVIKEANIGFKCVILSEWNTFSEAKSEEKRLKKRVKQPQRYCLICKEIERNKVNDNYGSNS